jgi:hypothetical protein
MTAKTRLTKYIEEVAKSQPYAPIKIVKGNALLMVLDKVPRKRKAEDFKPAEKKQA